MGEHEELPAQRRQDDEKSEKSGGDRNPDVDFRGQARSNDTHASKMDGEVRLNKKSKVRGKAKIGWLLTMYIAVFHLVRMRNLEEVA